MYANMMNGKLANIFSIEILLVVNAVCSRDEKSKASWPLSLGYSVKLIPKMLPMMNRLIQKLSMLEKRSTVSSRGNEIGSSRAQKMTAQTRWPPSF